MAEAAELARQESDEKSRQEAEERSRREEEERTRIAAQQAAGEAEEQARREAEEQARREAEERARREAEERARQEAEARSRREAEERARAEAERKAREEAEALVREAGEIARASGAGMGVSRASVQYREVTGQVLDLMGKKEQAGKKPVRWKWSFLVFVLAVIIIGLLYLAGVPRRPVIQVEHEERVPAERPQGQKAETARPVPAPEPEESLVLTVPRDMPIESDVYVVKQGDTLWAISKRFTGNPFNYPRVARDNKIANADLIFPDQRIRIKRQE
jgi:nucleoid-associated protein YgaU